ncbi:putative carboxypeptidase C [Helianthus annuus]|uniref:Carboxypeptidase C n=1 Tax=Helianthus annuus TaxID=4232 RepID=A0A251T9P6_HELAN|nr:putative carboxypeptidase C [Helianthus annuus]KAF5781000.1 putative carboxypeptidase C [Helianthus annuus]KAJ0500681.1 putative carboxypeptidase C [Helianthus annuus]KAJ0500684.1 putative carboxypeptidase C [Helianthus annuus]KAJ0508268.1 putative carboxypeptidase C [Helianthus annuus]
MEQSHMRCNFQFSNLYCGPGTINYYDIIIIGSLRDDLSNIETLLKKESVRQALGVVDIVCVFRSRSICQCFLMDWMKTLEVGIPRLHDGGIKLLSIWLNS